MTFPSNPGVATLPGDIWEGAAEARLELSTSTLVAHKASANRRSVGRRPNPLDLLLDRVPRNHPAMLAEITYRATCTSLSEADFHSNTHTR